MVYLILFVLTPFFTFLAQKQFKVGNKTIGIICMFFAILLPSLIAGIKSLSLGRDIFYVTETIHNAHVLSFTDYMNITTLEFGYKLFVYICTRISFSPHFTLFMLQFLTMLFVILFAYKNREKTNMTFVVIIYMLMWYCISLTFMRQSLSVAIIIFSTVFFQNKKYFKTLLLFIVAVSIHSSAIVGIFIYGLIFVFQSSKLSLKKKKHIFFIIMVMLLFAIVFFTQIIYFLTNTLKILPYNYYEYTKSYLQDESYTQFSDFIVKVFFLLAALLYKKFTNKKENSINIYLVLSFLFIDFSTFILSYQIVNVARIGLYFYYLALFYLLPNFYKAFSKKGNNRLIASALCIIVMFTLWIWKFPIKNWCETFPYRSDIVTFLH